MIMSDLKGKVWMDGEFIDWSDAKVHILTHFTMGLVCLRAQEHMRQLVAQQYLGLMIILKDFPSAELIGMEIPFSESELNKAQTDVVMINNLDNAWTMCFMDLKEWD